MSGVEVCGKCGKQVWRGPDDRFPQFCSACRAAAKKADG